MKSSAYIPTSLVILTISCLLLFNNNRTALKTPIKKIIKNHLSSSSLNLRLIILPNCSSCFEKIPKAIANSASRESFLIIGYKAETSILKSTMQNTHKETNAVFFYDRKDIYLSDFFEDKTYLFSNTNQLISSEYLSDYLEKIEAY